MASKVQLIGLDQIKESFGEKWPRVVARADRIAERCITRSLGDRDIMTRVQNLSFLVLFADVPQEEARLRCRITANEIGKQLIGENGAGSCSR